MKDVINWILMKLYNLSYNSICCIDMLNWGLSFSVNVLFHLTKNLNEHAHTKASCIMSVQYTGGIS